MKSTIMNRRGRWLAGTAICALVAGVSNAQEVVETTTMPAEAEDSAAVQDTVVIVGSRLAAKTAEEFKRNADTTVDSITATDIGVFPDRSIAEALQRVPGVSVVRTADPTDVTHYTSEPSGVVVRGLTQTRSEFNGRDVFSANSGYGLNYEDVSPALVSRVDTFKNQTAEMIEGGIAGTINIVTSVPFDSAGEVRTLSIAANYGDISKRTSPEISGVYSNRWDTDIGELGFLISGTHSDLTTTSRGAVQGRTVIFEPNTYADASGALIDQELYIPSGIFYTETEYDRVRDGISLAGQWESPDNRWLATAQYNRTSYENTWKERLQENYWKFIEQGTPHTTTFSDPTFIMPPEAAGGAAAGDAFGFQSNGLFGMGTIAQSFGGAGDWGYGGIDWSTDPITYLAGSTDNLGVLGNGQPLYEPCLNVEPLHTGACPRGVEVLTKTRYSNEERTIDDLSFNLKWDASDDLRFNFDYQHVEAKTDLYDVVVGFRTYADVALDLTSGLPELTWLAPSYQNFEGTIDTAFYNPNNYNPNNVMDHITDSEGTLDAFRADLAYDVDSTPWIEGLSAGVRFASRSQDHKWSKYNWDTVSGWNSPNPADSFQLTSGATYNDDGSLRFPGYEQGYWEAVNFGQDILGGGLVGNSPLLFMNFDYLSDRDWLVDNFSEAGQTATGASDIGAYWDAICNRPEELEGSCFTAGEIVDVSEDTQSAYAMLKIGGDDAKVGNWPVVGNVGVRYVELEVESTGSYNFAETFSGSEVACSLPIDATTGVVDLTDLTTLGLPEQWTCLAANSLDDQAFANGLSNASTINTTHSYVLPSLNLRFEVADDTFIRFAASKAISKPDIGLLKNYSVIRRSLNGGGGFNAVAGNASVNLDTAGNPESLAYTYYANNTNPALAPIEATQFDLSFERYFEDVGSFTGVIFYKDLDNYIQNGSFEATIQNNGVERTVVTSIPVNGDGASIQGFELAYRGYFDELPAPFDGLGLEANYTYVENDGVTNANLKSDSAQSGDAGDVSVAYSSLSGMINPGRLENLSDHTVNIVGVYEKGKLGARLAYNWRSEYLISVNDCCVGFPVWGEAEGFLDASVRYALTDNIEVSLQASNLLEERAETRAQVRGPTDIDPDQASVFLPASTFEYDRRFQLGLRAKF